MSGLSAHFAAGSSQLIHWKSVRPEMVITATVRLPHFAHRVGRSMAFSRFYLKPENRNACSTSMCIEFRRSARKLPFMLPKRQMKFATGVTEDVIDRVGMPASA